MNIMKVIFITKMRWSKFSIPNCDHGRFVMTPTTQNIHSISIREPTMSSPWLANVKKKTCGNYIGCCVCQTKGVSWSIDHTCNYWNNCSSFFKIEMSTSSIDTTCPKKRSLYSIFNNYVNSLAWMKWLYICNKKHMILASYFVWIELPTKF
jgi:hypothetical protein